jgi:Putative zinc-finger
MREARDELRQALREAAAAGNGPHPEPETLAAYQAGELAGEAESRVQDHLVACPECAALLLDLDGLADLAFGADRPGAAAEREAAWESFRAEIAAAAPLPTPPPLPSVVRGRFAPPPRQLSPWLYALAATLLLVIGTQWVEIASLSRRLSRPEANVWVANLSHGTVRGGAAAPGETVPAGYRVFTLILSPPAHPPYEDYEAGIVEAGSGRPVQTVRGLKPNPYGSFSFSLTREMLAAGAYRVRLVGRTGGKTGTLEEYALRVAPP